jgi:hypothetical protein
MAHDETVQSIHRDKNMGRTSNRNQKGRWQSRTLCDWHGSDQNRFLMRSFPLIHLRHAWIALSSVLLGVMLCSDWVRFSGERSLLLPAFDNVNAVSPPLWNLG